MVVEMERVGATGGASPLPYEEWMGLFKCESVQLYIEPRPTKSGWDSAVFERLV